MGKMITRTFKYCKGDIPGDQCIQWWTEKDWDKWKDHVSELKASGEYGKEEEITISMMEDPRFDTPHPLPQPMQSYSYQLIDLSKK